MTSPETRRPVVYLIAQPAVSRHKPPPDLSPLYIHGDVVNIIPNGNSPVFAPRECFEMVENKLKAFDPEIDFLVWAGGDVLSAIMVGMVLVEMECYCFNWLRYERKRLPTGERTDDGARYIPMEIDLSDPQFDLLAGVDASDESTR